MRRESTGSRFTPTNETFQEALLLRFVFLLHRGVELLICLLLTRSFARSLAYPIDTFTAELLT